MENCASAVERHKNDAWNIRTLVRGLCGMATKSETGLADTGPLPNFQKMLTRNTVIRSRTDHHVWVQTCLPANWS